MTKDKFRTAVLQAMESLLALPDDLFEDTYPSLRIVFSSPDNCELRLGLFEREYEEEDA